MNRQQETTVRDIHPFDVLLGRGKSVHHHSGNVAYRSAVKERSLEYHEETEGLKRDAIARDVIKWVWRKGGRFLRQSDDISHWEQCPDSIARAKVKQALRDFAKTKNPRQRKRSGSEGGASIDKPPGLQELDICRAPVKELITNDRNEDFSSRGLQSSPPTFHPNRYQAYRRDADHHLLTVRRFPDIHQTQFPLFASASSPDSIQRNTTPWVEQPEYTSSVSFLEPHLPLHQSLSEEPLGGFVWLENELRNMNQQGSNSSHVPLLTGGGEQQVTRRSVQPDSHQGD